MGSCNQDGRAYHRLALFSLLYPYRPIMVIRVEGYQFMTLKSPKEIRKRVLSATLQTSGLNCKTKSHRYQMNYHGYYLVKLTDKPPQGCILRLPIHPTVLEFTSK